VQWFERVVITASAHHPRTVRVLAVLLALASLAALPRLQFDHNIARMRDPSTESVQTFDELLGCVCVTNGLGGFTGTLTVVYRNPTPLGTPLTLRAWHDRTDGKKIYAKGTMHNGDVLCAEAEGIFVRSDRLPGGGVPADHV